MLTSKLSPAVTALNFGSDSAASLAGTKIIPRARCRHVWLTRLVHAGLALTIIAQLLTSLLMSGPEAGQPPGTLLVLHSYSGLAALGLAFVFWLVVVFRRTGTEFGRLMPWFSRQRRNALMADIRHQLHTIRQLKLPAYDETAALPSAVHGLGLLLMLVMAVLGAIWYFAGFAGVQNTAIIHLVIESHAFLANFVWAYLIAHAALALLHHYLDELSLGTMWTLAPDPQQQQATRN
jgi:hypothetical protein